MGVVNFLCVSYSYYMEGIKQERVIRYEDYMKCKYNVPLYLTEKRAQGRKCDYLLYMDSFGTRLYHFGSDLQ